MGRPRSVKKPAKYIIKEAVSVIGGVPHKVIQILLSKDDPNHLAASSITGQSETWLSIPKKQFSIKKIREYEKRGFKFAKK